MQKSSEAAELIAKARQDRVALPQLPPRLRPLNLSEAYAIQEKVHRRLASQHGDLAGYKVGCTSKVMQDYLAVYEPCSGGIPEELIHCSGDILRFDDYVRVGVECEIAIRLGNDLVPHSSCVSRSEVATAIEQVMPAIEIVDDRYVRWEDLGAPTLIADDFFAAGVVLGAPIPANAIDLLHVHGRALINGVEVGHGTGADVLGHPLEALAWLANDLASRDQYLRRGQIVLTGSMVRTIWLERGDTVQMEFTGLGIVEVAFR